jgi:glutaredoxin
MRTTIGLVCWSVFASVLSAALQIAASPNTSTVNQSIRTDHDQRCLKLEVFVRSDSALCQEAIEYAEGLVERREGICLEVVDTLTNKQALDRYWQLVRRFRVERPRVPIFYACNRLKTGFSSEAKTAAAVEELFAIHAYIRPTCQHCRDAKHFLTDLSQRWKGIRVIFHDLDRESGATQEMTLLARRHGIIATSFPMIFACGRVISGYNTDDTTGRQIEALLIKASLTERDSPNVRQATRHENRQAQPRQLGISLTALTVSITNGVTGDSGVGDESAGDSEIPLSLPDAEPPITDDETQSEDIYTAPVEDPDGIELPWIGYVRVRDWGLPAFTVLIGLIDGFNPCAMWVLVFLLSVLVNVNDRRKIAAIAGTFVIVSGLAYFAFMAAWLNVFLLVGIARPLQIALGVLAVLIGLINVKDFFAFQKGVTLSIPESVKPSIYGRVRHIVTTDYLLVAIGLSVILAILVNIVELMCTAGLPAVYTQILSMQQLPAWKNYAYIALYNVGYMFDDSFMVIAFVITLSHRKMRELEGRWLKLVSGIVVLALGLAMLIWPDWLQW